MTTTLLIIITGCSFLLAAASFWVYRMHQRMTALTNELEEALEQLIQGELSASAALYQETLAAKIKVKLKHLHEQLSADSAKHQLQHQQIQTLISDISHQVKTPIATIRILAETLENPKLDSTKRQELQTQLSSQIDKLDTLVQEMLKTAQLETGAIELQKQPLPILDTLAQAVSSIAMLAERKHIELQVHCDPAITIPHDSKWTAEALFNVLDNAVKYSPAYSTIHISCEVWEVYTKLAISDTGIGIDESEQAQVFQRFYRSQQVSQFEGLGIGLFLTRQIIQRQGGYIRLSSELGHGTTLDLFLPNT